MLEDPATALVIFLGALLLDQTVGEYPRVFHPVVWMGKAIAGFIYLAPQRGWWRQFLSGTLFTISFVVGCAALSILALEWSRDYPVLHLILGIFLLKACIALTELFAAARRVTQPIEAGDLEAARQALRSLCSRDPAELRREEILQATIESLAENLCDSWVAPLFYFLLLGIPGAVAYRAINTLDAMIGYRGRFEALGKFAARLDDLVNWIPARLSAALLLVAGRLCRRDVRAGWRILRRDGANTPSPNAGRPMAAIAGLLGIRLEKRNEYALGDHKQVVDLPQVRLAARIVNTAGWIASLLLIAVLLGGMYFQQLSGSGGDSTSVCTPDVDFSCSPKPTSVTGVTSGQRYAQIFGKLDPENVVL